MMTATVLDRVDAGDAHLWRGVVRARGRAIVRVNGRGGSRCASPTTPSTACRRRCSAATSRARSTVAKRIESGICHINGPTVHDEAQMPFGGVKASRLRPLRRQGRRSTSSPSCAGSRSRMSRGTIPSDQCVRPAGRRDFRRPPRPGDRLNHQREAGRALRSEARIGDAGRLAPASAKQRSGILT